VAVVTGGASGMGEATCHELGRRGLKVAVLDVNYEGARWVADELRSAGSTALGVEVDVTNRPAVEALSPRCEPNWGPPQSW
jgi:2-hydroxycyclohexanecarboxyl-CoA dehydrogenase